MIGQAMAAACRTVEGRLPNSLHSCFVLPGDPQAPIIYQVERLREGKRYSTRRVSAIQHGTAIFFIVVSFHAGEEGAVDHQDKMPCVPLPETLMAEEVPEQPMYCETMEFIRRNYAIELCPVELGRYVGQKIDDGAFMSGSRRRRGCAMIQCSICARWPMPPITHCSMR